MKILNRLFRKRNSNRDLYLGCDDDFVFGSKARFLNPQERKNIVNRPNYYILRGSIADGCVLCYSIAKYNYTNGSPDFNAQLDYIKKDPRYRSSSKEYSKGQ